MPTPFIGEIIPVAFGFAPPGWLVCNGQSLPINGNEALFALIGTTYGGDGQQIFKLPNLQGAVLTGQGQGAGLQNYVLGQTGGNATVALTATQLAGHSHALNASSKPATTNTPSPTVTLAVTNLNLYAPVTPGVAMAATAIAASGGGQAHENRQPFLPITYIIATQGAYPTQG